MKINWEKFGYGALYFWLIADFLTLIQYLLILTPLAKNIMTNIMFWNILNNIRLIEIQIILIIGFLLIYSKLKNGEDRKNKR